jgi:hypothetical protein
LFADSDNNLKRWKNYFSQLLNVYSVSDVRQIEIHTWELLLPDASPFEVEIAIALLRKPILPGNDQLLAEMIRVGGETLLSEKHKLIYSIYNKEELHDQWKESIIVQILKSH